jgi:NADH-quinone oxidoreductase subunit J
MESFFFYLLSAVLVFACLSVVLARNPLYNVLALVLAIFCLSSLFVLLEAYFVGIILLLVYAGAVLVFFLFVVMCLNINEHPNLPIQQSYFRYLGYGAGILFAGEMLLATKSFLAAQSHMVGASTVRGTIEAVGQILFTDYLLPFELTSLLLLIAIFGIVSLAKGALTTK